MSKLCLSYSYLINGVLRLIIMNFESLGWVKSSKYRIEIMKMIAETPLTPKEISDRLNLNLSNVSSYLAPMIKREIIVCLSNHLRKGRLYALSKKGKELIGAL